ncbi:helix-turn-helix domain-containing protein [Clostridium sp.]|uniref:helix-turn-helix domain-containing protein n=1 Tax=Clostridium sp. TaxID=1506 RepID=UPI00262EE065|nr:helix-turn-helix domain-containing protein [Clostridium sp.]
MKDLTINVGEKIKTLRKALNMTQSELAGSEMTKSMLSQIENNVSNPSMKTLQYIAAKLNKPVSYFLEDEDNVNNYVHFSVISKEELETNIKIISELIDDNKISEAKEALLKLMENPNSKKLKSYADILLKFGNALIDLYNLKNAEKYITDSLKCYTEGNFYLEASKAYIKLAKIYFHDFNYEESLNICEKAFNYYYKSIIQDSSLEIELYHYKILVLSALGRTDDTLKCLEAAINLSTKTSIYYKTDELYRLNGIFCYLAGNKAEYENSMKKAFEFAQFSENKYCLCSIYIAFAIVALESNKPEKALEYAEEIKYLAKDLKDYAEKEHYLYYLIKGKAYYILNNYELAYENIIKVNYPSHVRHKFDYLTMWSGKVYEGLMLSKLGKHSEGIEAIKIGIEKMSIFHKSKFLVHAYKSLSEIYSDMSDFENAFIYLKKSNEIQDLVNSDKSIVF